MARKPKPASFSFLRRNGLVLVFLGLTAFSLAGHAASGWRAENLERRGHGEADLALVDYLRGGQFLSSVFENWESEFLQMGLFVLLTVWLRQQGCSESRPLDPKDEPPEPRVPKAEQPWPLRRGGAWKTLYEHSLSLTLFTLFAASFVLHWYNSWRYHFEEQLQHGEPPLPLLEYLFDAQLWFESFQNWQSEFLSVAVLCLLSIWLREKDSPQSKPVQARHTDTGA
jgi:hypothetical protein